eukprot:13814314-Alexandrium_andersonii.AAC.1
MSRPGTTCETSVSFATPSTPGLCAHGTAATSGPPRAAPLGLPAGRPRITTLRGGLRPIANLRGESRRGQWSPADCNS